MNKAEALAKIEELKQYIDNMDSFNIEMVEIKDLTETPFNIGIYPVTNEQYRFIFPNHEPDKDSNLPVVNVSWEDCQEYIRLLNEKTGRNFALPTEHQWLVCATFDGTVYSGSNDIDDVAWYDENTKTIMPVGLKKPNKMGLYDMSGNVWEWCADKYNNTAPNRVLRGGSWNLNARCCRTARRNGSTPVGRGNFISFRLVENLK